MDEGEILIGRWDCSSCGTRGVMGDAYRCGSCGAGRPDDVEFYLPSDAPVVRDKKAIAAAKAGSDWMCDYCRQWVPATDKECPNCAGGAIAGSQRQKTGDVVDDRERGAALVRELRKLPSHEREALNAVADLNRVRKANPDIDSRCRELEKSVESFSAACGPRPERQVPVFRSQAPEARTVLSCLSFVAALALLIVGFWAIFHTTTAPATVTGHSWTRIQHVEEYTTLSQEGWDHPSDAYNIRSERREHHKERVVDHYDTKYRMVHERVPDGTERVKTGTRTRSLGNGRFERVPTYSTRTKYRTVSRQESYQDPVYRYDPVYRTYYFYLVDRWVPGADRREQGSGLEARWPPTNVRDAKQRMASREESYSLTLLERSPEEGEQPRTWTRTLDEKTWRAWPDGALTIVTLRLGSVIDMQGVESVAAATSSR